MNANAAMKIKRRFNTTTSTYELIDFYTPIEKTFTVYHLGIPEINLQDWRFSITGLVDREVSWTLAELRQFPKVQFTSFLECAGSPLNPTVPVRRVENIIWGGIRLNTLLAEAGVHSKADFIWARGLDSGIYAPTEKYNDSYLKDIPLKKAISNEVILATEMNGVPLQEEHGAPLRLVVPGFYGTNSVKWISEICVQDVRARGHFTTDLYNDISIINGHESSNPVWLVAPNSVLVYPDECMIEQKLTRLWGWCWGGNEIVGVDISLDDGVSWLRAHVDKRIEFSWQKFSLDWMPPSAGDYSLIIRAIDSNGSSQPLQGARNEAFKRTLHVLEC